MSGFPERLPAPSWLTADDWRMLKTHFHRIERLIIMATQAEVDAINAVTDELNNLEGPVTDIQNGIAAIEQATNTGQSLDVPLSTLKAAADALALGINNAKGALPVATPAPVDSTPVDSAPVDDSGASA